MADGGACRGKGVIADRNGRDKVCVAADESIVADRGVELAFAVVVAGDSAAAEVAILAYGGIADVRWLTVLPSAKSAFFVST